MAPLWLPPSEESTAPLSPGEGLVLAAAAVLLIVVTVLAELYRHGA